LAVQGQLGLRNKIINGAMMIDQRNAGASVTAGSAYTLDRWNVDRVWSGSTVTIQQSSTAPAGFANSLLATVSTGAASGSSNYFSIQQFIEGYNIADMAFGTASASNFTISFWVRSSVTGAYGIALRNSAFNLSYTTTYTISSANTWEYKTVTIAGPTSGTWYSNNSYGLNVVFSLGGGSTYKPASNNTWTAGSYLAAVGETDLITTTGATFYITGVQLEKGATATPFENRLYGAELALCQRYLPAWTFGSSGYVTVCQGQAVTGSGAYGILMLPVQARVIPTGIVTTGTFCSITASYGVGGSSALSIGAYSTTSLVSLVLGSTSGLVAGNSTFIASVSGGTLYCTGCEL